MLGEEDHHGRARTVDEALTPAVCSDLEAEEEGSSVCHRSHNEHDTLSVETDSLLRAGQVATISSAQPSQEVLASVTVPSSSLPDLSENGPAIVDISRFRTIVIGNSVM
jgi:hypothetical protein